MIGSRARFAPHSAGESAQLRTQTSPTDKETNQVMNKIFPASLHLIVTLRVADWWPLYLIFLYAPQEATMGEVQRIFYIHVASAWTALMAYFLIFLGSIAYLWKRRDGADDFAHGAAEVGFVFCTCVLVTGPLWAKPVWGSGGRGTRA